MGNFQKLEVYQRAQKLFPRIYKIVRSWNQVDQREIGSQMIRAANSIHANIAEGYNKTPNDFRRYISNSIGSCDELISHLHDAGSIALSANEEKDKLLAEYIIVGKQLTRLKQNKYPRT